MKKTHLISAFLFLFLCIFSFLPACSSGGGGGGGGDEGGGGGSTENNNTGELSPKTKIVDDTSVLMIEEITDANGISISDSSSDASSDVTFKVSNIGIFANMEVSDILAGGISDKSPYGYLRKIKSITNSGGQRLITTEPAALIDAVPRGNIDWNSGTISASQIESITLAEGVQLNNVVLDQSGKPTMSSGSVTLFDYSLDREFSLDGADIKVSGRSSFGFGAFFTFNWDYSIIPPDTWVNKFRTGVTIDQMSSFKVTASAGFDDETRISIAKFKLSSIVVPFVIPLILTPTVEVVLKLDGKLYAEISTSASESYHGELGVQYLRYDGWSIIKGNEFETDFVPPTLKDSTDDIDIQINAGPEISLMLYGIIGPYVYVSGFAKLAARPMTLPNWNLNMSVGAELEVGLKLDVLWYNETFGPAPITLFEVDVFNLLNSPVPDGIYLTEPFNDETIIFGPQKSIKSTYTGNLPALVKFYIDDDLLGTDAIEPFDATWDTSTDTLGSHTIKVESYNGSSDLLSTDTSIVDLREVTWKSMQLKPFSDDFSDAQIRFSDFVGTTGYVFGSSVISGVIKKTTDGGASWDSIHIEEDYWGYRKGLIQGSDIYATKIVDTDLFKISGLTKTVIYDDDFVIDFSFNYWGHLYATMEHADITITPKYYIAKINKAGTNTVSNATPITLVGRSPKIKFHKGSKTGIVFNIKPSADVAHGYMLSTNGGTGWTDKSYVYTNANVLLEADDIRDAHFFDATNIILVGGEYSSMDPGAVGVKAFVLKTIDGTNWTKIEVDEAKAFDSVTFIDNEEGFAAVNQESATSEPKLFHTEDGGLTWSPVPEVSTTERIVRTQFFGSYFGVAIGHKGTIFRYSME